MSGSAEAVIYEDRDRVAWLTIDRASTRNALGADVLAGLLTGMRRALETAWAQATSEWKKKRQVQLGE